MKLKCAVRRRSPIGRKTFLWFFGSKHLRVGSTISTCVLLSYEVGTMDNGSRVELVK